MSINRKNILCIVLAVALVTQIAPAFANLVPTTFGFPVIVQNGSTSALNQDGTARATDFENLNVQIPAYGDGFNLGGLAMNGVGVGIGTNGGLGIGADGTGRRYWRR